jgi:molybdenum cofactor cytidylyltransferase
MGSPKALLDFDGRTALRLALDAAAEAGVERSVVVLGGDAEEVLAREPLDGLPIRARAVRNLEEGSEQLRSLQIALESLDGEAYDAFFVHPVDHPLAAAADYRLLLDAFRVGGSQDGRAATVHILSFARRRGHPILCDRSLAPKLLALPGDRTARDVIERERIAYVTTTNAGVIEDMDTPEDYRRLAEAHRARRSAQQPS